MKVNKITPIHFSQKEASEHAVSQPRTYYTQGTTVTLTPEEEALYRNSIKETSTALRKWMLLGAGLGLGVGSLATRNIAKTLVISLGGAISGLVGSIIYVLITGKAQYSRIPQNKIDIENGLARQNLAYMNSKEVKNEN